MSCNKLNKIVAVIIAIIIAGATGCSSNDTIPEKMLKRFELNKIALNRLANEMLINPEVDFLFRGEDKFKRKANEFPETISKQLISLGLLDIAQQYWYCSKKPQKIFIYKTNWIPKDSISIVYNLCDSIETKKGFYKKDENSNEVWGFGDYWQMIKIAKYKVVDQ